MFHVIIYSYIHMYIPSNIYTYIHIYTKIYFYVYISYVL